MPIAILAGIGWHIVGAAMAASFYAPIEKVKNWSWETTWAIAGFFSWILLPIGVSLILLPNFFGFYSAIEPHLMLKVVLFGAMWGVGNISYGLTMRHLGMSLGIGVAIGVTLVVGTLVPPMLHGQFATLFTSSSGLWSMAGIIGGSDWRCDRFLMPATRKKPSSALNRAEFNVAPSAFALLPSCAASFRRDFRLDWMQRHQAIAPQHCSWGSEARSMHACQAMCSSWVAARS